MNLHDLVDWVWKLIRDELLVVDVGKPFVKLNLEIRFLVAGAPQHNKTYWILFVIELGIVQGYHTPIQ